MFSVSFFCVVSGSPDMTACKADNESVRKTAFLGFSVGEMTPPCGTPHIFTLLLKWPSSFTLADLWCRKHRICLYILTETPL